MRLNTMNVMFGIKYFALSGLRGFVALSLHRASPRVGELRPFRALGVMSPDLLYRASPCVDEQLLLWALNKVDNLIS